MTQYCLINGVLADQETASLRINDLSIRRGYGIFDFFRVNEGIPLYADRHIRRFLKGARDAHMDHGYNESDLMAQVHELIEVNGVRKGPGAIRITLTGGYSSWEPVSPNLIITYEALKEYDPVMYEAGASVITHEFLRELHHIKTISYMTPIFLAQHLRENESIEVLYHWKNEVSEFSRSNLFIVHNGTLITPDKNILPGITRSVILEIAAEKMEIKMKTVRPEEVLYADEVFMSSTIKRIIPVNRVDQHSIGEGIPGDYTRMLMQALQEKDEGATALNE